MSSQTKQNITVKERIFHSVLFEIIALTLMAFVAFTFTEKDPLLLTGLGLFMSLLAMTWNYIYNLGFDKKFGSDRLSRNFKKRFFHAIGFEFGLIFVSIPLFMYVLKLSFIDVLFINIGLNVFFLIYAIVYNWLYDNIKFKFFSEKKLLLN